MRVIIPLLILAAVFAAGWAAGKYAAGKNQTGPKLSRPERKELTELRDLRSVVRSTAAQHYDVYPELSQIIRDEVESVDRKIDEIRANS